MTSLVLQSWSPQEGSGAKSKPKLTKRKEPESITSPKAPDTNENTLVLPSDAIRVEEPSSLLENNASAQAPKAKDELVQHQPSLSSAAVSQTGEGGSLKSGVKTDGKTEGQPYKLGPETSSDLPRISFTHPSAW